MKYRKGIILSSVVTILLTGCVKPTGEANTTGTDTTVIDDTATSGTFAPTYAESEDVYNAGTTTGYDTGSSGTVYGSTTVDTGVDTSTTGVVTATDTTYGATDTYTNPVPASTTYGTNATYGATPTNNTTYGTNATYGATPTNNTTYGTNTTYGATPTYDNVATTPSSTYGTAGGAYGNPNGGTSTGGGDYYGATNDTYGSSTSTTNSGGYNNTYTPSPSYTPAPSYTPPATTPSYTTNNSYGSSSASGGSRSGIHLQVAALKDYYAAEEYKNNLSLDPKYSAYVKKGSINKVIVTGLESRAVAKALAARQFPGAFIVGGSALSSSSSSSSSYHNSYSSSSSSSSSSSTHSSSSYSGNGIGVQVGAFSTYAGAKTAAKKAAGTRYTALVKTVDSRGKKLYKAIVTGFSSASSARSAIASGEFGSAFLVTNLK